VRRPAVPRSRARRGGLGFTLLELTLSVAVLALLMGTMVSSILIASRSLDDGATQTGQLLTGADVLEELNADLASATGFAERTPTAVTFTVPDRTGDAVPETIRYHWSGPPDGQLLRQVNGGPAAVLAEDVQHFSLSYHVKTVAPE
jgi:Tfp pilus assembly protein FimT